RLTGRLRRGLDEIDTALREAAGDESGITTLRLSVMADFANVWLIGRLGDFTERYPHITLMLDIHSAVKPPNPNTVDIGIWHRRVEADGFRSVALPRDRVIAVCSAEFATRHPDLRIESLPTVPLLRFASRSWEDFFEAAGIDA